MNLADAWLRLACLLPLLFVIAFGPYIWRAWWMREKCRRRYCSLARGIWKIREKED